MAFMITRPPDKICWNSILFSILNVLLMDIMVKLQKVVEGSV